MRGFLESQPIRIRAWYVVLALVLLVVFGFLGLVGYYAWQLRFGSDATKYQLIQTFSSQFTAVDGVTGAAVVQVDNPATLIKSHNPILGDATAPVTIITFIDFECPYCRQAYPIFEDIRERFGPAVRIVFKHFPLTAVHPQAERAAIAAQCAHEQGQFWPYYQQMFDTKLVSDGALENYARELSLNMTSFDACMNSVRMAELVDADLTDGVAVGVRGTPTYIINGTKYEGVIPTEYWEQILLHHIQLAP